MKKLLLLELAVIKKLLDYPIPLFTQLERQLDFCKVTKREFTGSGFYVEFEVSKNISRNDGLDVKFGDVIAEVQGLINGAGFLLYVKDGCLDMLEGYAFDEDWPPSIDSFTLKYANQNNRDLSTVKEQLSKHAHKSDNNQ